MDKINFKNLEICDIEEILASLGQEKFRAKQIFEWIHKGIYDFEQMTNISKQLRLELSQIGYIGSIKIIKKFTSKVDDTKKYLFELSDGNVIESVLMKYKYGYSVCISSQVGCRMGCCFCASTIGGFIRNLEPYEMLEQINLISKDIGQRVSNIVIMGIGEPLDNYDNLIKFLKIVNDENGLNIGYRHITISTCGIVPNIINISNEKMPINLAISLHAPNDEKRKSIMPIAKKYTIKQLIDACKIFINNTNRRVTFEYALISGVNDSNNDAIELSAILKNLLCHVNLIPINKIEEKEFKRSDEKRIKSFQNILNSKGIETTIRRELGSDISASCGQLRKKYIKI